MPENVIYIFFLVHMLALLQGESSENKDVKRCVWYKKILPNGACKNQLKNYKIYQSKEEASYTNRGVQWWIVALSLTKNQTQSKVISLTQKIFDTFFNRGRYYKCNERKGFKQLKQKVEAIIEEMKDEINQCLSDLDPLICHIWHPVCLQSSLENKIILSPPCRRVCTFSSCAKLFQVVYNVSLAMHKMCPSRLRDPLEIKHLFTCDTFPSSVIQYVERCQLFAGNTEPTQNCYEKVGSSYNGTINITSSRKTCLRWDINPFLSELPYENLEKNFCRNPQGHAKRPWCYVNATSRDWEYCDVIKCESKSKRNGKEIISLKYQIVIAASVLLFLFISLIICFKKYLSKRMQQHEDDSIDAYYVCDLSKEEKMPQLLKLRENESQL